jgi:tetratricopeptide (TPR) repeat protein
MKKSILLFPILVLSFLYNNATYAQYNDAVTIPRVSQPAEVIQTIGLTKISVAYSRPLVKGREIFGKMIAHGNVWRAGADENTVLTLSSDATINNQLIKAGSYGLHIIPNENEWTVILNTEVDAWGSYFYKEEKDIARFTVTPQKINHHEALTYNFVNILKNSVDLQLVWAETAVTFTINIDTPQQVVENIRKELKSRLAFGTNGYVTAAQYCLNNDVNLEEALTWIERPLGREQSFTNLNLKAEILKKLGRTSEAETFSKKALEVASDKDLTGLAYTKIRNNNVQEAVDIFKGLINKSPKNHSNYLSLAYAYGQLKNKEQALKAYKKALKYAPKDQKERIQQAMDKL